MNVPTMNVQPTNLPEVLVVEPKVWGDERGFFFESYHAQKFAQAGIPARFVQDNHSRSRRGTLRGLHFQKTRPQGKLCRVVRGQVLDVAVDIRVGSPRFGRWTSVLLSEENQRQIWVPRGFAHGFVVLSESADFLYKCDDFYDPSDEGGVAWDDPALGIEWQWSEDPSGLIISDKDRKLPHLGQIETAELPRYG
jgi:dTDP-4-dehydrorhamnose 3,5-epimerase